MFYPENASLEASSKSVYGLSPVDTIVIDRCEAGWSVTDRTVTQVGYFEFVRWLETIYHRIDTDKNRIHVIGNGGLFTIAEVNASLANGATMILVRDAGRFSAAASVFVDHPECLSDILLQLRADKKTWHEYHHLFEAIYKSLEKWLNPDDMNEWIRKDWGIHFTPKTWDQEKAFSASEYFEVACDRLPDTVTPKQVLYRQYFIDFLVLLISSGGQVKSSDTRVLEDTLSTTV